MSVSPDIPSPGFEHQAPLRLVEAARMAPEDYDAQAADLLATMSRPGDHQANYELAWQTYVTEEDNPDLAGFSSLILGAYGYHFYQRELDSVRGGGYNHLNIPEQRSYRDQYRYALCQYNHQIRDFILAHGEEVPRQRLERWTGAVSGADQWAKSLVAGAVSEAAIFVALQDEPELHNLRFGSIEEDLAGSDMIGTTAAGIPLHIDIKSGSHEPVTRKTPQGLKLEISLRHQLLEGYQLTADAARGVRYLVELAIKQSQSHKHYHHPRIAAV